MKKKSLKVVLITISIITIILVILGLTYRQSGYDGFTSTYAVSQQGDIAYVYKENDRFQLYIDDESEPIISLDSSEAISYLTYTLDGSSLIYVVHDQEINPNQIESIVYKIDIDTNDHVELFRDNKIITEITVDPKNDQNLYYLGAASFEHYSPIASSAPHDFDIYHYSFKTEDIERQTSFDKYSMTSLQISEESDVAFVQMDDDFAVETADDVFEMKQRVFEVVLDGTNDVNILPGMEELDDIYGTFFIENEDTLIFQAVSHLNEDNIFVYELYTLNTVEKTITKLTSLDEHVANPNYSAVDDKVYFVVDKQFAKQYPDHYLYRMDLDGNNVEQIILK